MDVHRKGDIGVKLGSLVAVLLVTLMNGQGFQMREGGILHGVNTPP